MKHLKQFESFSKIYENSGEKTTQEVIARYKETPGLSPTIFGGFFI